MSPTVPPTSTMQTSAPLRLGDARDVRFDLVGDVRDHLNGRAEVVAAALLLDDRLVDLAGRDVVVAGQRLVDEALVVPEVEVGLGAVVGDEDLAVLVRVHRAGVDVDVRIQLLDRDRDAAALQQPAERGGRDPLPQRTDDAAGEEDELGHGGCFASPSHLPGPARVAAFLRSAGGTTRPRTVRGHRNRERSRSRRQEAMCVRGLRALGRSPGRLRGWRCRGGRRAC